ncbi:MAG: Gldg family protein [Planctomycetota bacterium]|nr:Gldg family protein [Planctomycetota bacterium]
MSAVGGTGARRVGRLSRVGTGLQVALTVALATTAVLLVNWLAARPGIRQRLDLTSTSENTLSTATSGLLERLDRDVLVEVLYRQERGPKAVLEADVMQRTMRMLQLVQGESGGRVTVEVVDTADPQAWAQRALELRVQGFGNGLVISCGDRRVVLDLDGDLAQFREGRTAVEGYIPPSVVAFTAEESLVEGILDVTRGDVLRVYFTSGSGEPDLSEADAESPEGYGQFAAGLRREGFELLPWSVVETAEVPPDCEVLMVLAPDAAWPDHQYDAVIDYAESGGRLVIVPASAASSLRRGDVPDLLEHFGLEVSEGRVAGAVVDPRTGRMLDGIAQCEVVDVLPQSLSTHPIVAPFREAGRNLRFYQAHRLRVVAQPKQGVAQNLITTTRNDLWVDAPTGPDLVGDLRYDGGVDGATGRIPIAATVQRPPLDGSEGAAGLEAIREVRVVGFGSLYSFTNAALQGASVLPAAVNWVADREHRIAVPPRDPDLRLMPRDDPSAMVRVTRFAQFQLPGAVALIGLVVWFRRTRGSRRRAALPKEGVSS